MKLFISYLFIFIFANQICHSDCFEYYKDPVIPSSSSSMDSLSTVHFNGSYNSDENKANKLIFIAIGGNVTADKNLIKQCSKHFENRLTNENGTVNFVFVRYPAKIVQKVVDFCNKGFVDFNGIQMEDLYDFSYQYDIESLRAYMENTEEKEIADQLDKEKHERLEASSSMKNVYFTGAFLFPLLLIFV